MTTHLRWFLRTKNCQTIEKLSLNVIYQVLFRKSTVKRTGHHSLWIKRYDGLIIPHLCLTTCNMLSVGITFCSSWKHTSGYYSNTWKHSWYTMYNLPKNHTILSESYSKHSSEVCKVIIWNKKSRSPCSFKKKQTFTSLSGLA